MSNGWNILLGEEFEKDYFKELMRFVDAERATQTIYPPAEMTSQAFKLCRFDDLKVVILGQDPYHEPGQANGLAFSVNKGVRVPPSLVNIYKEIGCVDRRDGDLTKWAEQGVLLLNATLTVRRGEAGSHQNRGWERFTDAVVKCIAEKKEGIVFMLWGSYAQRKAEFVDGRKHLLLKSVHPSPLSAHRGFIGNNHFNLCNDYLINNGREAIKW